MDALYTEAMVLADEARSYFESGRFNEESDPDNILAVSFSCESLKVTTRLMHCIAWLLNQKALQSGELSEGEAWNYDRALGDAPATDRPMVDRFPVEARQIVMASEELFQRLQRLSARMEQEMEAESAVQDMFRRLQSAF
jgi:regulator of CtrA degradation